MHYRESFPVILFLDQSGELGGAELCLADIAEFAGKRSAVLLFQDGPFAELLRDRKITVHIATLPKMAARVDKGARLFAYLRATPGMVMLILRALRIAKDFDLLYANTAKALIVGAVLAFVLRKKFCFHLHDILSVDHFSAINRRLIVSLANRAEAVVGNSVATAEAFRSNGGKKDLVRVIPKLIDRNNNSVLRWIQIQTNHIGSPWRRTLHRSKTHQLRRRCKLIPNLRSTRHISSSLNCVIIC